MSSKLKWIPKNWGGEQIIVNNEKYCSKILHFTKGYKCSLHMHLIKTETFFVLNGRFKLFWSDASTDELKIKVDKYGPEGTENALMLNHLILEKGDTFHVPVSRYHQMIALDENSQLLEISTQDFPEDSYRLLKGD